MADAFITPRLLRALDEETTLPLATKAYKARVSAALGAFLATSLLTFPIAALAARSWQPILVGLLWGALWVLCGLQDTARCGTALTNAELIAKEAGKE